MPVSEQAPSFSHDRIRYIFVRTRYVSIHARYVSIRACYVSIRDCNSDVCLKHTHIRALKLSSAPVAFALALDVVPSTPLNLPSGLALIRLRPRVRARLQPHVPGGL
jgi:hypothetical protein